MAVTVRKLYESVRDMGIELLAGGAGLNRGVRWVHMVESKEISTFLEGGEIAFTTGVGISDPSELIDIVKSVVANGGSGIVINIGPYIGKIGYDIIEFCEDRQIPLFSVPWNVHMAEIMRSFRQAKSVLDLAKMNIKETIFYSRLGLYKLLLNIGDKEVIKSYEVCSQLGVAIKLYDIMGTEVGHFG